MDMEAESRERRYADIYPTGSTSASGQVLGDPSPSPARKRKGKFPMIIAVGAVLIVAALLIAPLLGTLGLTGTASGVPALTHLGPGNGEEINEASVTLSWTPYEGAERYSIVVVSLDQYGYRLNLSSPTSSYVLHEVLEDGTYRWTVRAVVNEVYGPKGMTSSFTVRTGLVAPELSTPDDGSAVTNSLPTISWEGSAHADEYRLQVSTSATFDDTVVDVTQTGTSYIPTFTPADGTTYYWHVAAHHGPLWSPWSASRTFSYNVAVSPPTAIAPIAGATVLGQQVQLNWSDVADADRYQVQLSRSDLFESNIVDASTTASTYDVTKPLAENSTYSWRVRASDNGEWSPWSGTGRFFLGVESFDVSFVWTFDDRPWSLDVTINGSDYYPQHDLGRTYTYTSYVLDDDPTVASIAEELRATAVSNGYDPSRFILSFVQGITYTSDEATTGKAEYPRYPLETLVAGGGDCEDKAALFVSLVQSPPVGGDAVMLKLTSPGLTGHMAVGLSGAGYNGTSYTYEGVTFYYGETTSLGWDIGQFPPELEDYKVDVLPC